MTSLWYSHICKFQFVGVQGEAMESEKRIWKFLLIVGISPFLLAVGYCFVTSALDSGGSILARMTFWDYLIFYSFLYWPTYIIGIVLILLSFTMINRKH